MKYHLIKHHEHEKYVLSKFIKWAGLNPLVGKFWPAGRMFVTLGVNPAFIYTNPGGKGHCFHCL